MDNTFSNTPEPETTPEPSSEVSQLPEDAQTLKTETAAQDEILETATEESGESSQESSEAPESVTVTVDNTELIELMQAESETIAMLLESNQRIEQQNEACISILLIFLIVGMLNYVYKFFKLFF